MIGPLVWTAAERPDFVADVQAMRRRVVAHIPPARRRARAQARPGGLRDVEFAVQLLQLVHGRGDESLRVGATLPALDALRDGGYVGRDDALSLADAYTFLRATEHRLQLRKLRRTHVVPDDPGAAGLAGAGDGLPPRHARRRTRGVAGGVVAARARGAPAAREAVLPPAARGGRARAVGRSAADARGGRPPAGRARLRRPGRALQHIEALTSGLSRRATLQRALLPVLLSDFADAPDPDAGLLAYRRVSDELGATPWYLRLLRDEGQVASRLAYLLGTSQYVARMLGRAPEALRMLADDDELRAARPGRGRRHDARDRGAQGRSGRGGGRGARRAPHELLRTAFADLLGPTDVETVCEAISATTEATLETSLQIAMRAVAAERGLDALPLRFAIIAMGRLGGAETGYGSDADVMFVFEPVGDTDEDVAKIAQDVAGKLRALLSAPSSTDPPLGIDADLRPEGRNGPLVRSLASYAQYYARWSSPWEAQALLRARFACRRRRAGQRFIELIDPVRYPADGVAAADLIEIRRLKGRVDAERLPRGADPSTHTKLGRGGLADIEWTIQLLQLQHAGARAGAAHDPHARRAARGGRRRAARPRAGRRAGHGVAAGDPAAQRDHAGARQGRGPDPDAGHAAGRRRPRAGLPRRVRPGRGGRRLPARRAARAQGRRGRVLRADSD